MWRRQNGICSERTLKRIERATFSVLDYDVSVEDSLVVMSTTDREGKQRLWVARFGRQYRYGRVAPLAPHNSLGNSEVAPEQNHVRGAGRKVEVQECEPVLSPSHQTKRLEGIRRQIQRTHQTECGLIKSKQSGTAS